jgi:predicted SAM-dependent methyltransferase
VSGVVTRLKRTESPVLRHTLLRSRAFLHWLPRGHGARRRRVQRYLGSTEPPCLHFGAGGVRLPGWLDSDLISGDIYLDVTRPLPLPSQSVAYAFGEHVIEHIPEAAGVRLLGELRRVLRPGGVLRITTPDLRKIIALYFDENPVIDRESYARFLDRETGKRHERACQILNDYLRLWGHQYVYDEDDLRAKLLAAGFSKVERLEPGESEHESLRGLERHGGAEWVNRAEAMCLEASDAGRQ